MFNQLEACWLSEAAIEMREEGTIRLKIKWIPSFDSLQGSLECHNFWLMRVPRGKVISQCHSPGAVQAIELNVSVYFALDHGNLE